MAELIRSLLGEYHLQYDSAGNLIGGLAGLDYVWIIGAVLFVICLIFVFALIRSLFVHWFD